MLICSTTVTAVADALPEDDVADAEADAEVSVTVASQVIVSPSALASAKNPGTSPAASSHGAAAAVPTNALPNTVLTTIVAITTLAMFLMVPPIVSINAAIARDPPGIPSQSAAIDQFFLTHLTIFTAKFTEMNRKISVENCENATFHGENEPLTARDRP